MLTNFSFRKCHWSFFRKTTKYYAHNN